MTIKVDERTLGMWMVSINSSSNWLAHLGRGDDGKFVLDYRVRYYKDDKIFDSKDTRNWYCGEVSGTEDEVLRKMRGIFEQLLEAAPDHAGWELLRGERSVEEFMKVLLTLPSMHGREEPT